MYRFIDDDDEIYFFSFVMFSMMKKVKQQNDIEGDENIICHQIIVDFFVVVIGIDQKPKSMRFMCLWN